MKNSMTVVEKLYRHSIEIPDNLALVFENEEVTYGQLWKDVKKLESYLCSIGVQKGCPVVVKSLFSKWTVALCYAIWLRGAIFVPIDSNSSDTTIKEICKNFNTEFSFSEKDYCKFSDLDNVSREVDYSFPDLSDYANIMFTTGTTGNPKGVIWTHDNILGFCDLKQDLYEFKKGMTDLSFVPLNHAAPLWRLYSLHYFGGNVVLIDGMMKLNTINEYMTKYKVSSLYSSPAGISVIMNLAPEIFSSHADNIRALSISSSAINESQKNFLNTVLPDCKIVFTYGSSEGGADTSYSLNEFDKTINCVGKPCIGVSVKIVDDKFNDVPVNSTGTVAVKSRMTFAGYWNNPELSKSSIRNNYYITSDLGYVDSEGYLYILGRKDDIINIGGLKVYPQEIENAVSKLDGVSESVCFAVKDSVTGNAATLLVKLKADSTINEKDIRRFLSDELDSYKVPKYIKLTDSIEKTANGKINRKYYTK